MNEKQKKDLDEIITSIRQINCNDLFQFVSPFVIGFIASETIKTTKQIYNIKRDLSIKNVKILETPSILKTSEFKKEEIKERFQEEYITCIEKFYNTITNNIPYANIETFKKNIVDVTIRKMNDKEKYYNPVNGFYDCNSNNILLNVEKSIFHELFHMSNTIVTDNMVFTGFQQSSIHQKLDIGGGLNEGYTALLTSRYFKIASYPLESNIAEKVEKIVGQQKMEGMYFKADLYNLVQELKKYNTEQETIQFLKNLDFIKDYLSTAKSLIEKHNCKQVFLEINKYLIKSYSKKIKDEYLKNKITYEELCSSLTIFDESLNNISNNKKYTYLNSRELEEIKYETISDSIKLNDESKGRTK